MGACCSKASTVTSIPTPPEVKVKPFPDKQPEKPDVVVSSAIVATVSDQEAPKKEVSVVKHRKSHEIDRHPDQEIRKSIDRKKNPNSSPNSDGSQFSGAGSVVVGAAVRTSSCTKEEVDAILIQCGRLSRSSSGVKPAGGESETPTRGRRYSGSKRSFDFDMEVGSKNDDDDVAAAVGSRQREPRVSSPSSRRRSREKDPQQQRSGSKERGSGNGGRRVSRSPNRRSESPNPNSNSSAGVGAVGSGSNRPGKMVSVPATDKGNNAGGGEVASGGVKRIQVKRNGGEAVVVAGSRTAASPRSRSPARAIRILNENQNQNQNQQQLTLSRSNSKKAEHSPYRRNPLAEIDTNAAGSEQPGSKKPIGDKTMSNKTTNVVVTKNSIAKEQHMIDEAKTLVENPKHNQIVGRTRSSRLSRDLDINPETLLNPNSNQPSYANLLLEDIQNFHQKNPTSTTTPPPPAFSLPACVSKACSILEAVADLNSANNSTDRQFKKDKDRDNLVESEKVVNDDLMEPSLHKYVTVRRGGDAETEEQESSGSNSFAGSQQMNWMSSSLDLNSGDSTNCWTSNSRSSGRDTEVQKSSEYPRNGIGRSRVGVHGRSAYSLPNNATVGSS